MPQIPVETNDRMSLRIASKEKSLLVRAAALQHTNLTEFVIGNVISVAQKIIDENERLFTAAEIRVGSRRAGDTEHFRYLSPRGGFGQFLRRPSTFSGYTQPTSDRLQDTQRLCEDLVAVLVEAGLLAQTSGGDRTAYQLQASLMRWVAGDG